MLDDNEAMCLKCLSEMALNLAFSAHSNYESNVKGQKDAAGRVCKNSEGLLPTYAVEGLLGKLLRQNLKRNFKKGRKWDKRKADCYVRPRRCTVRLGIRRALYSKHTKNICHH